MEAKVFVTKKIPPVWGIEAMGFQNEHVQSEAHFEKCVAEALNECLSNKVEFINSMLESYYHIVEVPAEPVKLKATPAPAPAPEVPEVVKAAPAPEVPVVKAAPAKQTPKAAPKVTPTPEEAAPIANPEAPKA